MFWSIRGPCSAEPRPRAARRGRPARGGGFALLLMIGAAASAPAASAQPAEPAERAMESFNVGDNVYVRSLAIDKPRNSLWVGTSVGVLEIDLTSQQVKNTFTRDHGLANEYVFAIGVAPGGDVWFGTNAGGTSTYKDGAWKTYFPMHGLADYWVYAFAFQGDDVWIGTWDGVNRFATATDVFGGRTVYEAHCANCHGLDGTPVLPGTPNFTRGEGLMAPDTVLVPSLKAGKGLMPGFNHILSEKDILDVLVYTRTLQR